MSDKIFEWNIKTQKGYILRQGVLCAKTKKEVQLYLNKSFTLDEVELLENNLLIIKQIGDTK